MPAKSKSPGKSGGKFPLQGVWRYTLDRVEREDNQVRLEAVPLAKGVSFKKITGLIAAGQPEQLEWWQTGQAVIQGMSLSAFRQRLGLRRLQDGKGDELAEGMVFWLRTSQGKLRQVVHATQAARALSKEIYSRLLGS